MTPDPAVVHRGPGDRQHRRRPDRSDHGEARPPRAGQDRPADLRKAAVAAVVVRADPVVRRRRLDRRPAAGRAARAATASVDPDVRGQHLDRVVDGPAARRPAPRPAPPGPASGQPPGRAARARRTRPSTSASAASSGQAGVAERQHRVGPAGAALGGAQQPPAQPAGVRRRPARRRHLLQREHVDRGRRDRLDHLHLASRGCPPRCLSRRRTDSVAGSAGTRTPTTSA